jgi:hypothetical protein
MMETSTLAKHANEEGDHVSGKEAEVLLYTLNYRNMQEIQEIGSPGLCGQSDYSTHSGPLSYSLQQKGSWQVIKYFGLAFL